MNLLPKDAHGCPYLILAPMEGLGDRSFRRAVAHIGGFDETCTEFIRVPSNANIAHVASQYDPKESQSVRHSVQLMGGDPDLMAHAAMAMEQKGAPRIDLNCGCPSNTVTGRGAGSSLLKDPEHLYSVAKAMVDAVSIPVTAKLRSGFKDTSLFKENLLAAQESGVRYITLHPRTKADGYRPPARWDLIAEAKCLLSVPVVGNGDILTKDDALRMLRETGCDALMIGRGSVINPWIFHEIKGVYRGESIAVTREKMVRLIRIYLEEQHPSTPEKMKINRLKQLCSYLFRRDAHLESRRDAVLRNREKNVALFLEQVLALLPES